MGAIFNYGLCFQNSAISSSASSMGTKMPDTLWARADAIKA